jgi:hypothetical protein
MAFKLYRTRSGPKIETDGQFVVPRELDWNRLTNTPEVARKCVMPCDAPRAEEILAPIDLQEVWGATAETIYPGTRRCCEHLN